MRIGLFGGSFDPVHLGHLILAEQAREQAALDRVWFVPAARPPHKLQRAPSPYHQRRDMIELAISGHPAFGISDIEKDRPGPSFTVDTLRTLRGEHPNEEWFVLMGADSLREFPTWREPEQIAKMASLLVMERPGDAAPMSVPEYVRWQTIHAPLIAIASTDLRERVRSGRSIRYQTPRAVECYIETHRLYQSESA